MDHCWRCSPELLQSRHPIWKFNSDDRNISIILKVFWHLWRIYKILCYCISYWRFDDLKCFHPRHLQDCLSDCVYLAFSYKIERAVTKGFSHRFYFMNGIFPIDAHKKVANLAKKILFDHQNVWVNSSVRDDKNANLYTHCSCHGQHFGSHIDKKIDSFIFRFENVKLQYYCKKQPLPFVPADMS